MTSWSNTEDRAERTSKARKASPSSLEYWEQKLDPDGAMPEEQRRLRAEAALSAHMARLSLKASKARSAKSGRKS